MPVPAVTRCVAGHRDQIRSLDVQRVASSIQRRRNRHPTTRHDVHIGTSNKHATATNKPKKSTTQRPRRMS
jgi:hypothetical protein